MLSPTRYEEEKLHKRNSVSSLAPSCKDLPSIAEHDSEFTETTINDMSMLSGVQQSEVGGYHKSLGFSSGLIREKSINLTPISVNSRQNMRLQPPRQSGDPLMDYANEFAFSLGLDPKIFTA